MLKLIILFASFVLIPWLYSRFGKNATFQELAKENLDAPTMTPSDLLKRTKQSGYSFGLFFLLFSLAVWLHSEKILTANFSDYLIVLCGFLMFGSALMVFYFLANYILVLIKKR